MRGKGKGRIKAPLKPNGARRSSCFIGTLRRVVAADVDGDRNIMMPKIIREACDLAKIIPLDGVSNVAVRGQQGQAGFLFYRLQGANPRIELLDRQVIF